jgi:hypothetical protein
MFGTHVRHVTFRVPSVSPVSGSAHYERNGIPTSRTCAVLKVLRTLVSEDA